MSTLTEKDFELVDHDFGTLYFCAKANYGVVFDDSEISQLGSAEIMRIAVDAANE